MLAFNTFAVHLAWSNNYFHTANQDVDSIVGLEFRGGLKNLRDCVTRDNLTSSLMLILPQSMYQECPKYGTMHLYK